MDADNIAALGAILATIQQRLDAPRDDDFAHRLVGPTGDFLPSHTRAEQVLLEEARHKHQSQFQRVDSVEAETHPTIGTEPQRQSNLTTATALKQIPTSAVTWCNDNAFDTSVCNAQNNIEMFKLQFPGEIIDMVLKGTYDDAARGDNKHSKRHDHLVELAQRTHRETGQDYSSPGRAVQFAGVWPSRTTSWRCVAVRGDS